MNVKDIVIEKLKEIGADGLCTEYNCSCDFDDFMNCGAYDIVDCMAAKKRLATQDEIEEFGLDAGAEIYAPI